MSDSYLTLIQTGAIAFSLAVLWAAMLAYVWGDSARRQLTPLTRLGWVLAAALLPFAGFLAYLLVRLAARLFGRAQEEEQPISMTQVKNTWDRPAPASAGGGTLAVADLMEETRAAVPAVQTRLYGLAVLEGPHAGREFVLSRFPARIGRSPEAAISLDSDLGVSRQHAEITCSNGSLYIQDLHSRHGTQVNGVPAQDQALQPGDCIQVGLSVLQLKLIES